MEIDTLLTHEPSDAAASTQAEHCQQYAYSCASVSSGQSSPRDGPGLPQRAPIIEQDLRDPHASSDYTDVPYRSRTPTSTSPPATTTTTSSSTTTSRPKRSSPDSDEDDDQVAGDTASGKKVRRLSQEETTTPTETVVHEFACPFYKRNRGKYCHQRSCRTSGWPSVHRVKEHLYRHHMHYVCDRCSMTFKAQEHLRGHLRQGVACQVLPRSVAEDSGFDAEIEKRLRSRKKIEGQNEVDKWNHMFRILFPSYSTNKPMPSPFVEYSLQDDWKAQPQQPQPQPQPQPAREMVADTALQTMAMAAVAKQKRVQAQQAANANASSTPRHVETTFSTDLPPMRLSTSRCQQDLLDKAYHHHHARGGPLLQQQQQQQQQQHGPAGHQNSTDSSYMLSQHAMYELVQQQVQQQMQQQMHQQVHQVWSALSKMPNSPISPIAQKK